MPTHKQIDDPEVAETEARALHEQICSARLAAWTGGHTLGPAVFKHQHVMFLCKSCKATVTCSLDPTLQSMTKLPFGGVIDRKCALPAEGVLQ